MTNVYIKNFLIFAILILIAVAGFFVSQKYLKTKTESLEQTTYSVSGIVEKITIDLDRQGDARNISMVLSVPQENLVNPNFAKDQKKLVLINEKTAYFKLKKDAEGFYVRTSSKFSELANGLRVVVYSDGNTALDSFLVNKIEIYEN